MECASSIIEEDEKKTEVSRLFIGKHCSGSYSSIVIKLKRDLEQKSWKNIFCEIFANKR